MLAAIILFAIAAAGGLLLAILRLGRKALPMPVALLHGAVAAAGIVTLAVAVAKHSGAALAPIALAVFVVAALGGFVLFSFHLRKKDVPIPVMVVHALVAVGGFAVLIAAYVVRH